MLAIMVSRAGNPYTVSVHSIGVAKEAHPALNIAKGDTVVFVSMPGQSMEESRPLKLEDFRNQAVPVEDVFDLRPATKQSIWAQPQSEPAQ